MIEKSSIFTDIAISLRLPRMDEQYLIQVLRLEHEKGLRSMTLAAIKDYGFMGRIFAPSGYGGLQKLLIQHDTNLRQIQRSVELLESAFVRTDMDRIHKMHLDQAAEDYQFAIMRVLSGGANPIQVHNLWQQRWVKRLHGSSFFAAEDDIGVDTGNSDPDVSVS